MNPCTKATHPRCDRCRTLLDEDGTCGVCSIPNWLRKCQRCGTYFIRRDENAQARGFCTESCELDESAAGGLV